MIFGPWNIKLVAFLCNGSGVDPHLIGEVLIFDNAKIEKGSFWSSGLVMLV